MSIADLDISGNILLSALPEPDLGLIRPYLEPISLTRGEVMIAANQPIGHVHFLTCGIASITSYSTDSGLTEIGIFGREGMSGSALLLGADRSPYETFIQVGPAEGFRIEAGRFADAVSASGAVRSLLLRYVQTLLVQIAHCAVVNARHQIEPRLARWLLMCHDRTRGDEIALTHEFMAVMIGAQRSGVTLALHSLEGAGMIRSRRGLVVIRDRKALRALAADAYGVPEAEYHRLIGPLSPAAAAG